MEFNYKGPSRTRRFAVTVLTGKDYNKQLFAKKFHDFLTQINYPVELNGNLEYHKQKNRQNRAHFHGVTTYGAKPKNNAKNDFRFNSLTEIKSELAWKTYINKEQSLSPVLEGCYYSD